MIAQLILTPFLLGILLYALTEYRRSPAVGRQAHNLKVIGSNPIPATTFVITRSPSRSKCPSGILLNRSNRL